MKTNFLLAMNQKIKPLDFSNGLGALIKRF